MTTNEERYLPQNIFKEVMTNISKDAANEKFKKPNSVVEVTIEKVQVHLNWQANIHQMN